MSLLYAATYPQRTSALVIYGSYAKRSWAPDYPFAWNDEQWQGVLNDIEQHWGTPEALSSPSRRQRCQRLRCRRQRLRTPRQRLRH
jgi:hypothetical protein